MSIKTMTDSQQKVFSPLIPYMDIKKYSEMTGLTERAIEGMIQRGHLPVVKRGRRNLINLIQEFKDIQEVQHG